MEVVACLRKGTPTEAEGRNASHSKDVVKKIAAVLGISIDTLICGQQG